MKVYLVLAGFDYEGTDVVGVFTTDDLAKEHIRHSSGADYYQVAEFDVQGLISDGSEVEL